MEKQSAFKSGYVSIIGEPNVGKSTLLNAMMGEKLAIVTPKPQTTRNQITGIVTTDEYQIVFLDTPGVLKPKYRLHNRMLNVAYSALKDADLTLYMVDVNHIATQVEEQILATIRKDGQKAIFVINKIDLAPKLVLLPIIAKYKEEPLFVEIIPISAKTGDGVNQLRELIIKCLPAGQPYFPDDQISDLPERFFVAETIREKIFLKTQQEIPYASSVIITVFKQRTNGTIYISATINVERSSQKRILIGKGGKMIKLIGQLARSEIQKFLNASVFLDLHVSVKEDWRRDEQKLKDMGYT